MASRYNDTTGELEEFDNGPYERDDGVRQGHPKGCVCFTCAPPAKLDPGKAIARHWTGKDQAALERQFYGDVINKQLGRPPVPCPNRNAEENDGSAVCACFQCYKARNTQRADETWVAVYEEVCDVMQTNCAHTTDRVLTIVADAVRTAVHRKLDGGTLINVGWVDDILSGLRPTQAEPYRWPEEAVGPTGREPFKGTLHCPCCQRELCTVASMSAMVHVTKPCEGCEREGRTVDITPEDLQEVRAEREAPREGWMDVAKDMRLAEQIMDDVDGSRQSGLVKAARRIAKYRKTAALCALLDQGADSPIAPPGTFDRVMKRLKETP